LGEDGLLPQTSTTLNRPTPLQAPVVALDLDYAGVAAFLYCFAKFAKSRPLRRASRMAMVTGQLAELETSHGAHPLQPMAGRRMSRFRS
jgi:hypothetical protein